MQLAGLKGYEAACGQEAGTETVAGSVKRGLSVATPRLDVTLIGIGREASIAT